MKYTKGKSIQLSTNFKSTEFDCKCKGYCTETLIDAELITTLQKIRDHFGKAITINSGYRCKTHNKNVGGVSNSRHMEGKAADIVVKGVKPTEVAQYAESIGVRGIGLYNWGVHIDTRASKSYWTTSNNTPVKTFFEEQSNVIYRVQVGSFLLYSNATKRQKELKGKGFSAIIVKSGLHYRVQVGAYKYKRNAQAMKNKLVAAGYDSIIVEGE
jgi:hypothetical protein